MFIFRKKVAEEVIHSPIIGTCIPIEQVNDHVFAEKMLGDGLGFVFEGDTVYSPCDGEIVMIASTKHAFGIKTKKGTEILVHIGLDTVELQGKAFNVLVDEGARVKLNDPIVKIDRTIVQTENIDFTTVLVFTNKKPEDLQLFCGEIVNLDSVVCKVKTK